MIKDSRGLRPKKTPSWPLLGGKIHALALVGAEALSLCSWVGVANAADRYYIAAAPTAHQTTRFNQGVASLYDELPGTVARVKEVASANGVIALEVFVLNRNSAPINFGPENVRIATSAGVPLNIIPYEQLVTTEEKRQRGQRFWSRVAAVGRAMSAADAGTTYGSGTYSGSSFGQVGGMGYTGSSFGSFSYSSENPAVTAAAQRDAAATNLAERRGLEERQAAKMASYDGVLRTTTIEPQTSFGGTVQFEVPKDMRRAQFPIPVWMEVTVNGEVHKFLGQLQKSSD
jgi:hypothetical protein